ncbi:hypothetical protein JOM56_001368, partial [Amanita muscaria]
MRDFVTCWQTESSTLLDFRLPPRPVSLNKTFSDSSRLTFQTYILPFSSHIGTLLFHLTAAMAPKRTLRLRGPVMAPPVASTSSAPFQMNAPQGDPLGTSPLSDGNRSRSSISPGKIGDVAALSAALELESPAGVETSPAGHQPQSPVTSTRNSVRAGGPVSSSRYTQNQASPQVVDLPRRRNDKGKEKALYLTQAQNSPIAELGDGVPVTHTPTITPVRQQGLPRTPVATRTHSTTMASRASITHRQPLTHVTPHREASLLEHGDVPRRVPVTDENTLPANLRKRARAREDSGNRAEDQPFSRADLKSMLSDFRADILAHCRELYQPPG